jgi:hypothetical protein
VIGVLASAALVVAAELAFAKAGDCNGPVRQGAARSDRDCDRATPTAADAAASAEASRSAAIAASAKRRAERADYQLLYIYPNEASYRKLRAADLEIVIGHLQQAMVRLDELRVKRKRLDEKAEFYKGKPLPPDLQLEMDQSEAAFTASAYVFGGLEEDVAYIVAKYERPRARLEKLWAGAPLGSMGLYDPGEAASAAK